MLLKIFKIDGLSSVNQECYIAYFLAEQSVVFKKKTYSLAGQKRKGTGNEAKPFV
jgi:hypothetical protein